MGNCTSRKSTSKVESDFNNRQGGINRNDQDIFQDYVKVRVGDDFLKVNERGHDTLEPHLEGDQTDSSHLFKLTKCGLVQKDTVDGTTTNLGTLNTPAYGVHPSNSRTNNDSGVLNYVLAHTNSVGFGIASPISGALNSAFGDNNHINHELRNSLGVRISGFGDTNAGNGANSRVGVNSSGNYYLTHTLTAERCGKTYLLQAYFDHNVNPFVPDVSFVPVSNNYYSYTDNNKDSSATSEDERESQLWIMTRVPGDKVIMESCKYPGYCLAASRDNCTELTLERVSQAKGRGRLVTFYVVDESEAVFSILCPGNPPVRSVASGTVRSSAFVFKGSTLEVSASEFSVVRPVRRSGFPFRSRSARSSTSSGVSLRRR